MKPRILVVEDDPVSQEVIASLLRSRGYETHTADDGFGALRLAQETDYELVFIDYHLPEMDGYALARLMRSLGEKTNSNLKMVAITADQFGLAARRGVDTIFDRVLSKPIEPETLFAFVDAFLGQADQLEVLEDFLAPASALTPVPADEPASPSLTLWRARGLPGLPKAAVFPAPTPSEKASLEQCFRVTPPQTADCLILLRQEGLAEIEALRRTGGDFLKPLLVVQPELAPMADVLFEPANGESWTAAARLLTRFTSRCRLLRDETAAAVDMAMRLAAFLFVSERPLVILRSATGAPVIPYTAGFPAPVVIDAVKQLAARGLVIAKLEPSSDAGTQRLIVTLTSRCSHEIARSDDRAKAVEDTGAERRPTAFGCVSTAS